MNPDDDRNTNFGWWTDKPLREDRGTSAAPLHIPRKERDEPVWIKSAVIITIMLVFGISLFRLFDLIP